MRNVVLTISYDGTEFSGFQRQVDQRTVQGVLEDALFQLEGDKKSPKPITVYGSGRTDSGVHALNQVVNFYSDKNLPASAYLKGLNSLLPNDLRVRSFSEAHDSFHARKSATAKEYHYWIRVDSVVNPIGFKALEVTTPLSFEHMKEAIEHFEGTHDFAGFRTTGSSVETTTRTIYRARLMRFGSYIIISLLADGFLYNMVRIIVGTILDVGRNKLKPQDIPNIIMSRDRTKASATAPANGLYLYKVYYTDIEELFDKISSVEDNDHRINDAIIKELANTDLDIKGYFT